MSSITLDMHPVAWCSADLESGTRTIASCRRLVTRSGVVTHYLTAASCLAPDSLMVRRAASLKETLGFFESWG
ncbi:hypothetical protein QC764_0026820 [Podospora pseudoanserina]|uniref:Uncharacterized protein n=1 Tax=Podospora pseudoanserina TaxID=2609844 RepID=A0ABR0ISR6_9PEZI|nr:hypothetical protein QC764_0026820 [Podospora pseudoanserina]